jgi:hypothetical protein
MVIFSVVKFYVSFFIFLKLNIFYFTILKVLLLKLPHFLLKRDRSKIIERLIFFDQPKKNFFSKQRNEKNNNIFYINTSNTKYENEK